MAGSLCVKAGTGETVARCAVRGRRHGLVWGGAALTPPPLRRAAGGDDTPSTSWARAPPTPSAGSGPVTAETEGRGVGPVRVPGPGGNVPVPFKGTPGRRHGMAGAGRPEAPLSAEVQVSLTEKPEGEGPRARAATLNLALWKEPGSEGCAPWGTGTEGDWLSRVGSASQRDCGWLALRETPEMSPASPELFGPWAVYAPLGRRCPAWTPILTCSSLHRGYPPPGSPHPSPFFSLSLPLLPPPSFSFSFFYLKSH